MIDQLEPADIAKLMEQAPSENALWVGPMAAASDQLELIPFQFGLTRFMAAFFDPLLQVGGPSNWDGLESVLDHWANGHTPAEDARLIKFARADAKVDHYEPRQWPLEIPRQIFQFGGLLGKVVEAHARSERGASEYLYSPTEDRLGRFYTRVYGRLVSSACSALGYAPILALTGELHGYKRS